MSATTTIEVPPSSTTPSVSNVQIKELIPGFCAEVHGLDYAEGVNDANYALLREIITKVRSIQHQTITS